MMGSVVLFAFEISQRNAWDTGAKFLYLITHPKQDYGWKLAQH
jgi:hypothetical protein